MPARRLRHQGPGPSTYRPEGRRATTRWPTAATTAVRPSPAPAPSAASLPSSRTARGRRACGTLSRNWGRRSPPAPCSRLRAQDMVLVAVNRSKLPGALARPPDWGGRIVIDANNPIEAPLFSPAELTGRASSEIVAGLVAGARLVKAFDHLPPPLLEGDPAAEGGRRSSSRGPRSRAGRGRRADRPPWLLFRWISARSLRGRGSPSSPAVRCRRSTWCASPDPSRRLERGGQACHAALRCRRTRTMAGIPGS